MELSEKDRKKIIKTSVILSVLITFIGVRWCFSLIGPDSIKAIACGNPRSGESSSFSGYSKIIAQDMTAVSNVDESPEYSLKIGKGADKLVDGNKKTQAAPANKEIDYIVKLPDVYEIKSIKIFWGVQGTDPKYISKWSLESSLDDEEWTEIATGTVPGVSETSIKDQLFTAAMLRIKASSEKENWIGVNEIEIVGRPL